MSLVISTELQTILDGSVRTIHQTCEITFPSNPPVRVATAPLTIGGNDYVEDLRAVGEIRRTIENPVDRVSVAIQNVDRVLSQDLADNPDEWRLAEAVVGRRYSGSGETEWIELFRGIVQQPTADDMTVRFDIIPDVLSKGQFIAARSLAPPCQFRFKDANTCGYAGPETACNHHLRSKGGCIGLGNGQAFGGTEHKYNPDTSAPGTGSNTGGGPPACPRLDQWIVTHLGPVRAGDLTMEHRLFNPIDGGFHRIRSLQIMRGVDLAYIVSESGADCWSSMTHKVLWYREHITGEVITKFVTGDPLLCWNLRGRLLVDSRVSLISMKTAIGDVMKIEMATGHIYCSGGDGRRYVVAHNAKNPIDPIE